MGLSKHFREHKKLFKYEELAINLIFNDSSDSAISQNMKIIQEALDVGGNVSILGNGTLYWKGWTAEENLPAFSQPGRLLIGDDTDFYSGPGIEWKMQPNTYSFGLFSNKNYTSNRVAVTAVSAAAKVQDHAIATITLATPINIKAGGYVIFGGFLNTGYAWNDGFRVRAVDVEGAATVLTFEVSKDVMVGVTLSALDSPYVYLANGNYSITIEGPVSALNQPLGGAGNVIGADLQVQPEIGFINSNKTKRCRYSVTGIDGLNQLKSMVHTNSYDDVWEKFRKRNSGAGITICGPSRNPLMKEVFNEGQEDAVLLQTSCYPGAVHRGNRDADGTQAHGSILNPRINNLHCNLGEFRSLFLWVCNALDNVNIQHRIDGLTIDNFHARVGPGVTPSSAMHAYYGATAAGGGGYLGRIAINNLIYEDTAGGAVVPSAVLMIGKGGTATPRAVSRCGGIHIKNVSIPFAEDTAGSIGLRNSLILLGQNMPGFVVDECTIESGDIVMDVQNGTGTIKLVQLAWDTVCNKSKIGAVVRQRYCLQSLGVSVGGTGYAVGDTILVTAGQCIKPAVVKVTTVSGGVVTGISVIDKGAFDSPPSTPTATVGGSGSGLTLSFSNTYRQVIVWGTGATNSGWIDAEFTGNTLLEGTSILAQTSNNAAGILNLRVHDVRFSKLRSLVTGYGNSSNISLRDVDMSNVAYNVFETFDTSNKTHSITASNVKFNSANAVINATAALTGIVINWRSGGANQGLGANNLATNTSSGGWTFNFYGNCADLKHDMNTVTLGRIDGAIVNEGGGTIGTPAAIGPGLVACFGTAAGSWKSLNPSKSANSY